MGDSDTDGTSVEKGQHWIFDCQQCDFTSEEPHELAALEAADKHCDYGPGHFDFEIRNPDGEAVYP